MVVVIGDVNSTLACALGTAKLEAIALVEAGLRNLEQPMPEAIGRILTRPVIGVPVRRFLQRPRDHAIGQELFQQARSLDFPRPVSAWTAPGWPGPFPGRHRRPGTARTGWTTA